MTRLGTVSLITSALLATTSLRGVCQDQPQPDREREAGQSSRERSDSQRPPVEVKYDTDENVISASGKARIDLDKAGGAIERWWQSWWEEEKHGPRDTAAGAKRGVRAFIRHYDENDDQQISRRELPQSLHDDFDYVDRDEDRTLSAAELREFGTRVYNVQDKRSQTDAKDEERTRTGERDQEVQRDATDDQESTGRATSGRRLRTVVTIDERETSDSNDQTWSEWWQSWFEEDEGAQASATGARERRARAAAPARQERRRRVDAK